MTNIADGAIRELPGPWRKVAWGALMAVLLTIGYFTFIELPIADARDATRTNASRIDKVETDISTIKSDVADIKSSSAARDQKVDDLRDTMDQINQKLDRVLEQRK